MFVHLLNADQLKTPQRYRNISNYQPRFKELYATMLLDNMRIPPKTKGAPGKIIGACTDVKYAKRFSMTGGPIIEVTLSKLVSEPCNSPCAFGGTCPEIVA